MRGGSARPPLLMRIAYLTGRSWRGNPMPLNVLPTQEQPDHKLLVEAGAAQSLQFETRYWDDPALPEAGFDAALIRSCWDYTQRCDEFLAAMQGHESNGLRVVNPPALLRWNARKIYLKDLGETPIIDTVWLDIVSGESVARAFDALDAAEIVIKPQVGAGSRCTIRLKRNSWSEADLIAAPQGIAMAQPFLPAIATEGEISLLWFGGAYSHAVRKTPNNGTWLANRIEAARYVAETPSAAMLRVAELARASMPPGAFYVRIDLVSAAPGDWRVIEIEAIEPYLFLAFAPEGARTLVAELSKVLAG